MRAPKLRELKEAITAIFSRPFTSRFPFAPAVIAKEFRGKPVYIDENCIRCGACAVVCPALAITVEEKDGKRIITRDYARCIFCGQCLALCPVKNGIEFTNEFAMATLNISESREQIEDELVYCERCGKAITTKKHLLWLYRKLGAKAYANPTVFLVAQAELGFSDIPPEVKKEQPIREDWYKILCPSCRRSVYAQDEWGKT